MKKLQLAVHNAWNSYIEDWNMIVEDSKRNDQSSVKVTKRPRRAYKPSPLARSLCNIYLRDVLSFLDGRQVKEGKGVSKRVAGHVDRFKRRRMLSVKLQCRDMWAGYIYPIREGVGEWFKARRAESNEKLKLKAGSLVGQKLFLTEPDDAEAGLIVCTGTHGRHRHFRFKNKLDVDSSLLLANLLRCINGVAFNQVVVKVPSFAGGHEVEVRNGFINRDVLTLYNAAPLRLSTRFLRVEAEGLRLANVDAISESLGFVVKCVAVENPTGGVRGLGTGTFGALARQMGLPFFIRARDTMELEQIIEVLHRLDNLDDVPRLICIKVNPYPEPGMLRGGVWPGEELGSWDGSVYSYNIFHKSGVKVGAELFPVLEEDDVKRLDWCDLVV